MESALRLVIAMISSVTNTSSPSAQSAAAMPAEMADQILAGSNAFRRLRDILDAFYSGADLGAQHWTRVSRDTSSWRQPTKRLFGSAEAATSLSPTVKPFGYGLYTSTPMTAGYSMWRLYLDPYYGSDLFPLPWYTWQLKSPAAARIVTIDDARGWTRLVASFPRIGDGWVYPDWARIASQYDGVRLTFPAVIATQGIRFVTPHGPTAPGFWDVESTYWLRWSFTSAVLLTKTV